MLDKTYNMVHLEGYCTVNKVFDFSQDHIMI